MHIILISLCAVQSENIVVRKLSENFLVFHVTGVFRFKAGYRASFFPSPHTLFRKEGENEQQTLFP